MTRRADLHTHTTASDGMLRPSELVLAAAQAGLQVLAVTDHDSTDGVAEALAQAESLPLVMVPGVELNARTPHGEAHILGYFVQFDDRRLTRRLAERRSARDRRGEAIVRRLGELGYKLSWSRVLDIAEGGSVGRPHVARALVEAGYAEDVDGAFRALIGKGAPAYIPTPSLAAEVAVRWILEAGGIPVFAHPLHVLQALPSLRKEGLVGLEVYYGAYNAEEMALLARLAESEGLLQTGGSDFHGNEVMATAGLGSAPLPWGHVERLMEYERARHQVVRG
ncbi:MAG: PHP domain-containing protein [Anaerolineae bacterium]|nr:PHP domain-containing protein [Anaerolineae bacterium]